MRAKETEMTDPGEQAPPDTKLTRSKELWAREHKFLTGREVRPEAERLPPGQHLVRDWPVLDLGIQPTITKERWKLDVTGAVEVPIHWDWAALQAQPQSRHLTDIHCVTTWSRYDNRWDGVRRYTGAQQLYEFPLAVIVGLSEEEQLAATERNARVYLWRAAFGRWLHHQPAARRLRRRGRAARP